MDTKNITVIGVWSFVIIWMVASFVLQADLLFSLILFFVAIAVSIGATASNSKPIQKEAREEIKSG